MPLEFYSPKSDISRGGALFVTFNSKDANVTLTVLSQTGWNAETKKGSFKGGQRANIKLSKDEIGALIYAISNKTAFKFYHQYEGRVTSGSFSFYEKDDRAGFGLIVDKDNTKFKVGLGLGSAETLKTFLLFSLHHMFSAIYAADKKAAELRRAEAEKPTQIPKAEQLTEEELQDEPTKPSEDEDMF